MKEPSKRQLLKYYKKQLNRIARINKTSFNTIEEVRSFVQKNLEKLISSEKQRNIMVAYITKQYINMFTEMRTGIINCYNSAMEDSIRLTNKTIGRQILSNPTRITAFPREKAFQITNKVLSEKAVTIRSNKMARQISAVITNATEKGYSIEKTARLVDIQLGYRDKQGKINDITLKHMRSGRITRTNGHFYNSYRIARTESMRMSSLANEQSFEITKAKIKGTRLKLLSYIDSRTRAQSEQMNGQISDKEGRFLYPNGKRYKLGSIDMPAKYGIQDRETTYTVFLE